MVALTTVAHQAQAVRAVAVLVALSSMVQMARQILVAVAVVLEEQTAFSITADKVDQEWLSCAIQTLKQSLLEQV